jgi:hypothetical protein
VKKLCDNKLKEISLNDPKTIGTKEHMSVHIYIGMVYYHRSIYNMHGWACDGY